MARKSIANAIAGLPEGTAEAIRSILNELQSQKFTLVAGAAANTAITVAGITTDDALVEVLMLQPPTAASGNAATDVTADASISANGAIKLATTNSTGNQLLVVWVDESV